MPKALASLPLLPKYEMQASVFMPAILGATKETRNRCTYRFSQSTPQNEKRMSMGVRIKTLREAAGLSQAELARRIDISQPSLHAIENNKTRALKASTLVALCRELRTTADYIQTGEDRGGGLLLATMEAELLYTVRSLSHERRMALLEYARFLIKQEPPASVRPMRDEAASVVRHLPPRRRSTDPT